MKKTDSYKELRSSGFVKWLQHLILFVTYPIRHFYIFFSVLLLACIFIIGIPTLHGVSFKQIPAWYQELFSSELPARVQRIMALPKEIKLKKFKKDIKLTHATLQNKPLPVLEEPVIIETQNKQPTPTVVIEPIATEEKQPEMKVEIENIPEPVNIEVKEEVAVSEPTKYASWNVHKPTFEERPQKPEPENILQPQSAQKNLALSPMPNLQYKKLKDLNLVYLDTPERITGETIIYGANELSVDDTYLYLYGIYTNPNIHDVQKARTYLRELIADKNVECYIVAKTQKGLATAICFADGKNINQNMVNAYLADNIAL